MEKGMVEAKKGIYRMVSSLRRTTFNSTLLP
jgi:hypothetical protein